MDGIASVEKNWLIKKVQRNLRHSPTGPLRDFIRGAEDNRASFCCSFAAANAGLIRHIKCVGIMDTWQLAGLTGMRKGIATGTLHYG